MLTSLQEFVQTLLNLLSQEEGSNLEFILGHEYHGLVIQDVSWGYFSEISKVFLNYHNGFVINNFRMR